MKKSIILGPQLEQPFLPAILRDYDLTGKLGLISAGWQEHELDDQDLHDALPNEVINLRLHGLCEEVFHIDQELFNAHRERQNRLQEMQIVYRHRLSRYYPSAVDLINADQSNYKIDLDLMTENAIKTIRELDEFHLEKMREVHSHFIDRWNPLERDSVKEKRDEIWKQIRDCELIAIAGGHVAILLNRMKLLGIAELLEDKHLLSWSAGSMVLSEKIVAFHDDGPQGRREIEVIDEGLGLIDTLIPFPHAKSRLKTEDFTRMSILAQRFSKNICVTLDEGSWFIKNHENKWEANGEGRFILKNGMMSETPKQGRVMA